ncbi:MAG: cupredoxin domain-containing protein [Chloroflexi bacterium]|nr:cupredoxin domain-containing protein [Chloroflexota bacterium]
MNRYRPTLLLAVLASLFVLLAACSAESAAESEAADESTAAVEPDEGEVRIVNSVFEPGELTVSVGTEVVFTNEDSFAHTVTEGTDGDAVDDPIVDEEIAAGGEVRVTFDETGTYDITCEIHPDMQMTITVEG